MTNPLTSLDELIWKQCEKVTQYAQKNYGWDKYDLAKAIHLVSSIGMVGMCTYGSIHQALEQYNGSAIIGAMILPIALHHNSQERFYERLQKIELQVAKVSNAAIHYDFKPLRSTLMIASLALTTFGIGQLIQSTDTKAWLEGLIAGGAGLGFGASQGADYFITQLPTPPSTKKPFWKTTYEGIKSKFKPTPQLEPAVEPSQQYATIDNLITYESLR